MLSPIGICPYQDCDLDLASRSDVYSCACERTRTLVFCGACGAESRAGSRFCRRCRKDLPTSTPWAPELLDSRVTYLGLKGVFRRPPLTAFGSLFAVNTVGQLQTIPLQAGAASDTVAELPVAASSNCAALVKVPLLGKTIPGWTFLAIHPEGIEAVILNTGEVRTLHEARVGAELAVNAFGLAAPFRAVASDGTVLGFAERTGPSRFTLAVLSFVNSHLTERPLSLEGTDLIGPVLHRGLLALCTDKEVGVYDILHQIIEKMALPRNFTPLAARRQDSLNVPPGSVPLAAGRSPQGLAVHVAGTQNGVLGLLNIELQTGLVSFDPVGRLGSVTSNQDGSLTVAAENEVQVVGNGKQTAERVRLQFGMPASFETSTVFAFVEETRHGVHRVTAITPGRGRVSDLVFEDLACNEISCSAPVKTAYGVAVPYFDSAGEGGSGSKVAFWNALSKNV